MTIRTRFAPSPTGYLHIGGVRTALFNWLFARQHRGQFLLRVDDTDQQRNVQAALAPILRGFQWLGLAWDEGPEVGGEFGPYYQSQRGDLYQHAVDRLLESGAAYRDFATPDELQAEREKAQVEGQPFIYSRRFAAETPAEAERLAADGRQGVVRLKMPREGSFVLDDMIRGQVQFQWDREQDHVVQRADGSCLYHLATVVDDHAMRISHVIRAEEHLSNTPRQVFIARALGYEPPRFAHVPYVAEPGSKNKLSKRKLDKYLKNRDFAALNQHGQAIAERLGVETSSDTFNPVIVDFYQQIGFLPEALLNYLVLLGWSLDDKREEFTLEEMVELFSLERVNRAPASFDPQKLWAFQDRAMQQLSMKRRVAMCLPYLQEAGCVAKPPPCDSGPYLSKILEAAGDRVKMAGDVLDYADFFTADDLLPIDAKAFKKRIDQPADARELLLQFADRLETLEPFDASSTETCLKQFVEEQDIKIGQVIHALRVATTGKAVGFGMFETLAILGRARCVARIRRIAALSMTEVESAWT